MRLPETLYEDKLKRKKENFTLFQSSKDFDDSSPPSEADVKVLSDLRNGQKFAEGRGKSNA